MASEKRQPAVWSTLAVLVLGAVGLVYLYTLSPETVRTRASVTDASVTVACLLSGLVILRRARRGDAWKSAPYLGAGMLLLGAVNVVFFALDLAGRAGYGPSWFDVLFLLIAAVFLVPLKIEYSTHFPQPDRREIAADVALITAALSCIVYLYIKPDQADAVATASSAILALIGVSALATYGALALWVPSPPHLGLFAAMGALATAVLGFGKLWVAGEYVPGQLQVDLPIGLAALLLAALVEILPAPSAEAPVVPPTPYGRPLLTALAVAAACAALGTVATMEIDNHVGPVQGSVLIAVLAAAMAIRILVNQLRSSQATRQVEGALDEKEAALRETDLALARLREANETLRESEERLRLVFEAAVDGIVELDEKDVVLRANEAFCRMVEMPRSMVEGQPWTALAAAIEAEESFATLPSTGQGTLRQEGHALYLEARSSHIPGDPPRRLLLVRDVTAARVADQTIRSLFKFLQDRDEDRTRLLRRTNAAIESERNRIARDLHDGPVQGVSAASLSLEAVLLMLKAGEIEEGLSVLSKVREELSGEADNLRRLMSGLRPPLLEERGLTPALRETLDKFGHDNEVETEFVSRSLVDVPTDLETLAYRIVQEALSNASKHASAKKVAVTVEAVAGQLRVEVTDDGVGFEAARAREFLREGRVGLASMRERVELANGTFMVHTTPGRGTTVQATLPLDSIPAPRELAVNEA